MMTIENYRVTRNRVLVKVHEAEKKTTSGFYLASAENETISQGEVVRTGPGKRRKDSNEFIDMEVSTGDLVVYETGRGISLKFDGYDLLLLEEDDIIGVVTEYIR